LRAGAWRGAVLRAPRGLLSVLTIYNCVQVRGVVQYYVHYVDYNKRLDEWVTEDRLDTRKIEPPQVSLYAFNGTVARD